MSHSRRLHLSTAMVVLFCATAGLHPARAQGITIDGGETVTVPGTQESPWDIGSLIVGYEGEGTLSIGSNGTVRSETGYLGENPGSTGTVTVIGEGATWSNSYVLYVGYEYGGEGTLDIRDGGSVTNTSGYIGYGASVGTVTVSDATWSNSANLYVGEYGSGTLNIVNGGTVANTNGVIGAYGSSSGTVTVSDATWTNSGALNVGLSATGKLIINAGGEVSANGNVSIGTQNTSTGTATVSGEGALWAIGGSLSVGYGAQGTLDIEDGGTVTNGAGYIGYANGSTGEVTVSDATWTNEGDLAVGFGGAGELTINADGTVTANAVYLGLHSTSSGTLALNGTYGARGVLETGFIAAQNGSASLTFEGGILRATADQADFLRNFAPGEVILDDDGAFIDSNGFDIGIATDLQGDGGLTKLGAGTLTLTGASTLDGYTLVNGGTLAITDGGSLGSFSGYIGDQAGSNGAVLVSNASWTNIGGLYVGNEGNGELTITDGGIVEAVGGVVGFEAGSSGDVTVSNASWRIVGDSGLKRRAFTLNRGFP